MIIVEEAGSLESKYEVWARNLAVIAARRLFSPVSGFMGSWSSMTYGRNVGWNSSEAWEMEVVGVRDDNNLKCRSQYSRQHTWRCWNAAAKPENPLVWQMEQANGPLSLINLHPHLITCSMRELESVMHGNSFLQVGHLGRTNWTVVVVSEGNILADTILYVCICRI